MALVKTENIGRTYGKPGVGVVALAGVGIEVETGSFLALVGPSGSGKTTLLNLIGGLDRPDEGRIFVEGKEITKLSAKELADFRLNKVGFVFQEFNLIPVFSALENVEYVMLLKGVDKKVRRGRALSILEEMGLGDMAKRMPNELSGGQKQRVAVSRAIAAEPTLILADEPTANLDSKTGAALIDKMKELNEKKGMTFIFSTHDRMVVDKASRVINLKDGRVVE
ncbi:MAG: ABC transporter ATP-binding protein [Deltaproteobacteria bacterium]|nr:ABC transporter ATP-binding protein [Deltaproteobacteria bacterium]